MTSAGTFNARNVDVESGRPAIARCAAIIPCAVAVIMMSRKAFLRASFQIILGSISSTMRAAPSFSIPAIVLSRSSRAWSESARVDENDSLHAMRRVAQDLHQNVSTHRNARRDRFVDVHMVQDGKNFSRIIGDREFFGCRRRRSEAGEIDANVPQSAEGYLRLKDRRGVRKTVDPYDRPPLAVILKSEQLFDLCVTLRHNRSKTNGEK